MKYCVSFLIYYFNYSSVSSIVLIWTGLHCSQGPGYAVSACFIKYIEVKSTSSFPMTSSPCLRMALQGPVTTLRSHSHPLKLTLTTTLFMEEQSPYGTRCQLTLLVLHRTQNSSEECLLIQHNNGIYIVVFSFFRIPCNWATASRSIAGLALFVTLVAITMIKD